MSVAESAVGPSSAGTSATTTTLTWAHTCGTSDTLLIVDVAVSPSGSDSGITLSVTYNGTSMTSANTPVHAGGLTAGFLQRFYLLNPTHDGAAHNVVVTRSGGSGTITLIGGSVSYTGTSTSTAPTTSTAQSSSNGTTATITKTSSTGNMVSFAFAAGTGMTANTQTLRWSNNASSSSAAGNARVTDAAGAASVTGTATIGASDAWAAVASDIPAGVPAASGTGSLSLSASGTALDAHGGTASLSLAASGTGNLADSGTASLSLSGTKVYPYLTSVDSGGRFFLDQFGNPFFPVPDHQWHMLAWGGGRSEFPGCTPQSVFEAYASIQHANGFNAVLVEAVSSNQGGGAGPFANGNLWDGTTPWVGGVIGTLNSAYWSRLDGLISAMADRGITVVLNLISSYTLQTGTAFSTMTTTDGTNYGAAIGARYKNTPNLVYHFGADYFGTFDTQMAAVITAIRAAGDNHPIMLEYMAESETRSESNGNSPGTLGTDTRIAGDDVYTYNASYLEVARGHQQTPARPTWYFNGYYDNQATVFDSLVMDDAFWALTSGAAAVFYGAETTWQWAAGTWSNLSTDKTRTTWVGPMLQFWSGLTGWQNLVPDYTSTLITSARGTKVAALTPGGGATPYTSGNTYITGAVTPDGSLAVIYTPASTTITLNAASLSATYTAKWVDPYTFATTSAAPNATSYTTPGTNSQGNNRWLLVTQQSTTTGASGTGSLSLSGSANAKAPAAGSSSLTLAATGVSGSAASAAASVSLAGAGSAATSSSGTAALSLSGAGTPGAPATASGALALSGSLSMGGSPASGTAGLALSGSGVTQAPISGAGALTLAATGSVTTPVSGSGALALAATGTAADATSHGGTAALTLAGSGVAVVPAGASALLAIVGTGTSTAPTSAAGTLTFAATGTGTDATAHGGTAALTLGGTAGPKVQAAGVAYLSLYGSWSTQGYQADPARTYTVAGELRSYVVPAESRTFVPTETRTYVVEA